ncbi:MAG: DUF6178 family protein [Desulfosarcinaceae bacterium]|nr:DUF6178 family protein [Desulfosarcinaceae bacterium]
MQIEKKRDSLTETRLALKQRRAAILRLEPQAALTAILETPQPAPLVHSFPAEDLHLLIREIGPEDALPLLALASDHQWEYMVDAVGWRRDRLHLAELTRWMHLLLKADPKRLARWCLWEKHDLTELYLNRNIEVVIREYDQPPSELGKGFLSHDDTYYWRLRPLPEAVRKASPDLPARREMLVEALLKGLSSEDHPRYQQLLLESAGLIPAETEEELYRLRTVRLAERGFVPFDEAVGAYQPLTPEDLLRREPKSLHPDDAFATSLPVPSATAPPQDGGLFAQALAGVQATVTLLQLQAEFAHLCNQVIVADQVSVSDRGVLAAVVAKVSGYLDIAVELVLEESPAGDRGARAVDLIQRYRLADLFRVGIGAALALKGRCERWHRESWYRDNGLALSFWEEAGLGVLGGLLIKRPLFFDNYRSGVLYREFQTLQEIRTTEAALNALIAIDNLLSLLAIEIGERLAEQTLTYRNLLLTAWALGTLDADDADARPRYAPVEIDRFRPFFDNLWSSQDPTRRIDAATRRQFIAWLVVHSHLTDDELNTVLGPEFDRLFDDLAEELASVAGADLDPRFVTFFSLRHG